MGTPQKDRAAYANTDSPHDTHIPQFLLILFWDHILIDGVEPQRALLIVPMQCKIQYWDLICCGQHNVIIYL